MITLPRVEMAQSVSSLKKHYLIFSFAAATNTLNTGQRLLCRICIEEMEENNLRPRRRFHCFLSCHFKSNWIDLGYLDDS